MVYKPTYNWGGPILYVYSDLFIDERNIGDDHSLVILFLNVCQRVKVACRNMGSDCHNEQKNARDIIGDVSSKSGGFPNKDQA